MNEPADPLEALRATAARYRGGFEAAAVPMCIGDMDMAVVTANPAMLALLGWQHDEVCGRAWSAFTHPDDLARGRRLFEELRRGRRRSYRHEKRYVTRSGGGIWVGATVSAILDTAGQPFLFIEIAEDLSDRKAREAALGEGGRRFRAAFDQSAHRCAALLTPDGIVVEASRACLALAGRPRDQVVGRPLWEVVADAGGGADAAALRADVARCRSGEAVRRELTVAAGGDAGPGDAAAVVDLRLTPVRDEDDDEVALLLAEGHDVTAWRRAEAELRARAEAAEALARLSDGLPVGVLLLAVPGGEILACNPAARDLLGLGEEDGVLGRSLAGLGWDAVGEDGRPFPAPGDPLLRAVAEGRPLPGVVMGVRRPGGRVWLAAHAAPEAGGGTGRIVCTLTGIGGQRRADETLGWRARLLDQLGLAVLALDRRPDRVRYWNAAAERLTGRPADGVLGRTVGELDLFDGWTDIFEQIGRRLDEGERWTGRLLAMRGDGSAQPVFANVASVADEAGGKVGVVCALMEITGPLSLPGLPALGAPDPASLRAAARLTPRQFDVLGLIMRGYANKRIARDLGVETGTVRMHVNAILKTLNVRNRTEAALIGTQLALSGPPELAARLRGGGNG